MGSWMDWHSIRHSLSAKVEGLFAFHSKGNPCSVKEESLPGIPAPARR